MSHPVADPGSRRQVGRSIPKRYIFFGLAGLGLLMSSIDSTIVAVAIPSLTSSLNTSLNWVVWTLTGYQLVQMIMMPLAGKLSDGFGRKRVFMFCVGCFTVGSLLSGLAPNIGFLIFFRAIQAIGGGGLMPSAVGIVADQFKERRNQAIGLFTSILPMGGILGPNIGGWILEHWSWREIFFVNLPIGVAILIGAQLLLRERPQAGPAPRIDIPGLGLFFGGMLSVMYAITWVGSDISAWRTLPFWLLLTAGILMFVFFFRQERQAENPILDPNLVAKGPFLPANIYNFIFGACAFGFFTFIPYYAVVQYQMSPALSGAVLTPRSVAIILMSLVTSILLLRLGYRIPMMVGTYLMIASLMLISFGGSQVFIGPLELGGFWLLALVVAISGLGQGLAAPASNNASIDLFPAKAAVITGLRGMFRHMGSIMGVSVTVLVLSFYDDKAAGLRTVFAGLALLLLVTSPLPLFIPDLVRERRQPRSRASQEARLVANPAVASDLGAAAIIELDEVGQDQSTAGNPAASSPGPESED